MTVCWWNSSKEFGAYKAFNGSREVIRTERVLYCFDKFKTDGRLFPGDQVKIHEALGRDVLRRSREDTRRLSLSAGKSTGIVVGINASTSTSSSSGRVLSSSTGTSNRAAGSATVTTRSGGIIDHATLVPKKRGRGRPPGARNRTSCVVTSSICGVSTSVEAPIRRRLCGGLVEIDTVDESPVKDLTGDFDSSSVSGTDDSDFNASEMRRKSDLDFIRSLRSQ